MAAIVDVHGQSRPDLWQRIEEEPLPRHVISKPWRTRSEEMTFAQHLERELELTPESACRLQAEYRRFLYLKAMDGGRLTPSAWGDKAWHLHLDAPDEAWNCYCDTVLGRTVAHETGLTRDQASSSFARTLDLYRQEFGADPPTDIWHYGPMKQRRQRGSMICFGGLVWLLLVAMFWLVLAKTGWLPLTLAENAVKAALLGLVLIGLVILGVGVSLAADGDLEGVVNCG